MDRRDFCQVIDGFSLRAWKQLRISLFAELAWIGLAGMGVRWAFVLGNSGFKHEESPLKLTETRYIQFLFHAAWACVYRKRRSPYYLCGTCQETVRQLG
jgi:hypothetical protein